MKLLSFSNILAIRYVAPAGVVGSNYGIHRVIYVGETSQDLAHHLALQYVTMKYGIINYGRSLS